MIVCNTNLFKKDKRQQRKEFEVVEAIHSGKVLTSFHIENYESRFSDIYGHFHEARESEREIAALISNSQSVYKIDHKLSWILQPSPFFITQL